MLFRLFLIHRQLFLSVLGMIGRNGKVYFHVMDVGLVLGQMGLKTWCEEVGSCLAKDIVPDGPFPKDWVIEWQALLNLLRYRMSMGLGYRTEGEKALYELLELKRLKSSGIHRNVLHLKEGSEGQDFKSWMAAFRG